MSEALRFNEGKPMLAYFMRSFPRMVEAVARVKEMGAIKYNDGNWRLGNKPDDEYWNSCFRHLDYIFGGEDYDKDTGCLHIAHAVWNLCALLELNYHDMPAIDEEVFRERATYWAEQKRIRESGTVVEEMPEFIDPPEPEGVTFTIKDAPRCESFERLMESVWDDIKERGLDPADVKLVIEKKDPVEEYAKAVHKVLAGVGFSVADFVRDRKVQSVREIGRALRDEIANGRITLKSTSEERLCDGMSQICPCSECAGEETDEPS